MPLFYNYLHLLRLGHLAVRRFNAFLLANLDVFQRITAAHHSFVEHNNLPNTDQFILWASYKAYMCGIFIQLMSSYI